MPMKGLHPGALLVVYGALAALPAALLVHAGVWGGGAARAAAILCGALALALLLMQFLSSGRYETVSGRAGIDRVMRAHGLGAAAVLVLALLHPLLFFVPATLEELRDIPGMAAAYFTAPHLLSGSVAWALLLALVPAGLLRKRLPLRYEVWRASHALMAAAAAALAVHHALAVGSHAAGALVYYWWGMGAIAIGTLVYLYLVKPFILVRRAYRVVSNVEIGHGIREIAMLPARGVPLDYRAGQFAWVMLDQAPFTLLDHPFSFSSAPSTRPELRMLIKARGDFTRRLHTVLPGAPVYIDGPHGSFTLEGRPGAAVALIAGGIGIAPVISLLRELRARRDARPIAVLYGARNTRQLVHADEIREAAGELDLSYRFFVDEPAPDWDGGVGELTLDAVRAVLRREPAECLAFLCGPNPMVAACREHLRTCGVPARQIVYERFDYA